MKLNELENAIELIAKESAERRYGEHMGGAMMPRGLDPETVAMTLNAAHYGNTSVNIIIRNTFEALEEKFFQDMLKEHWDRVGINRNE